MKKILVFVILLMGFGLISGCETITDDPITEEKANEVLEEALLKINISETIAGDVNRVVLPNNKQSVYFEWSSSDETIISKTGSVIHDLLYDQNVTLSVTAKYAGYEKDKIFEVVVKNASADEIAAGLLSKLELPLSISEDLNLLSSVNYGEEELALIWESSNQELLTNEGLFKASVVDNVNLVAKLVLNGKSYDRTFVLEVYPRTTYIIKTLDDFANINNDLDGLYLLDNDLDFSNETISAIGTMEQPFTGIFRGRGYELNNISLSLNDQVSGLFSVNEGLIEKVALNNFNLTGNIATQSYVGGFVGLNKGLIDQCFIDGLITLTVNRLDTVSVGGFTGQVDLGEITNCVSSVLLNLSLTSQSEQNLNVGGFAGLVNGGLIRHSIYEDHLNGGRTPKATSIAIRNAADNSLAAALFVGRIEGLEPLFEGSFALGSLVVGEYDADGTNPQHTNNFAGISTSYSVYESCYVLDTCYISARSTIITCNQMSPSTMVTEDWYNFTLKFDKELWDYTPIHSYNTAVARLNVFN